MRDPSATEDAYQVEKRESRFIESVYIYERTRENYGGNLSTIREMRQENAECLYYGNPICSIYHRVIYRRPERYWYEKIRDEPNGKINPSVRGNLLWWYREKYLCREQNARECIIWHFPMRERENEMSAVFFNVICLFQIALTRVAF